MSSLPPPSTAASASPTVADRPSRNVPQRSLDAMVWLLRAAMVGLIALWSVLLLVWLILHWGILPHIDQWRGAIEKRAGSALGIELSIGEIKVRSSSWVPSVELRQVVLFDPDRRPALVLPRVVAALSPKSLLAFDLRFQQLFVDGAQLEVRRDRQGRIFVAGFDIAHRSPDDSEDGAALRWLLKQPEFVIRGGSLRWTDELRDAPPLVLGDVLLVLRNGLRRHALQLDATPPAEWGERFSLRGRFRQPLLQQDGLKDWTGTAYADLPRADVRQLQRYLDLPFDISEGDGALRAWVDLKEGVATAATVDLALRTVEMRLGAKLQPLQLERIEGRLLASRQGEHNRVEVRQLGFRTGDGLEWPRGDIRVDWKRGADGSPDGGELRAERIDLDAMSQVAAALPIGEPVRRLLAETRPQGQLSKLELSFTGAPDAPSTYRLSGNLDGLALAAKPAAEADHIGRPGLSNANLSFQATEQGGEAQLRINDGAMSFPGVFAEPTVPFGELSAGLSWRIEAARRSKAAPKISVLVKDARFANADASGSLSGNWSTGPGEGSGRNGRFPGRLEVDGRLAAGSAAARVARYLPLGIDAEVRTYVENAVRSGTLGATTFRMKGSIWDFPYGDPGSRGGEFRIAGKVDNLNFAFLPSAPATATEPAWQSPWPAMTQLSGELIFDRTSMEIRDAQARIGNVRLNRLQARIASFSDAPTLLIDGRAKGPAAEMLKFVNATPVGEWLDHSLAQATIGGEGDLGLALTIPLGDGAKTTVKGSLTLAGNDVRLRPDTLPLANARGRVDFSERGFQVVGASARLLGGEASFEGGSQPDGSLRFSGGGTASAEGLRRASELGPVATLARNLSGQTSYRAQLGFVGGYPELNISSNLVGLASDLPMPLRKAAEAPLPLRYQVNLAGDPAAGGPVRDTLRLELGTLLQAQYQREYPREPNPGGAGPRVLRGGLGINERAPTPASGVGASISVGVVDADAWQAVAARFGEPGDGSSSSSMAGGYAPQTIALRARQLLVSERQFNGLVAGLSLDNGNWRANLEAEQLSGYVEYRPARSGAAGASAAGRVYARLSRLSLPKQEAEHVEDLLEQQPASVPALDIVVEDFELRGKRLGRVEIAATNRQDGGESGRVREWRLTRLNVLTPEARLTASGSWGSGSANPDAPRRSEIDFRLELADSGGFLERLEIGRAIRGGKGEMAGRIGWRGSPLSLDYKTLRGQFKVAIEAGQFLKAEPGAARLLSVLNLQALPRRLALDFRDVFQRGFAFDSIAGDVGITQGVARTNNLVMRGTQAAVLMEGVADIEKETQDIRVIVVPEINVGTASLAYAAINPAVGLGAFLAQLVLRKPLIQASTREFHVSGSWDDPKVERVDRRFDAPLPDLEPAPLPSATASAPAPASLPAARAPAEAPPR
ncbi:YhdP family protein [Piscinibacter sakaiensis]|uniref:YhdP family protein n=1 Tax=Piscinibacter sakaiensis TaxID=1547922 RepID=UPI003AABA62F